MSHAFASDDTSAAPPDSDSDMKLRTTAVATAAPISSYRDTFVATHPLTLNLTSRSVKSGLSTTDVTQEFTEAASRLGPGRLVKDEPFTLFEAVSAIEIGDAKMDSGYLEDGEFSDEEFEISQSLSVEQILWMMDELFYHEVAWHMGYPLSQTLFTSLHINALLWPEPKDLEHAQFNVVPDAEGLDPLLHLIFRSYCLALIKACDLVRNMVVSQHFYEEEDFATQTFHRELLHGFRAEDIYPLLERALLWLDVSDVIPNVCEAIKQRLLFRREILQILGAASDPLQLSSCNLTLCFSSMQCIKMSGKYGTPVADAFSPKIQRRLASSVPPRPMIRIESEQAFVFIEQFLRDFSRVHELLLFGSAGQLLQGFWTFMAQSHQPSVYVRALVQSLLSPEDRLPSGTLKQFILGDLRRLILPNSVFLDQSNKQSEVLSNQRFQISQQINDFLSKSGQSYLNIFRTFCLNRCRIRRTLCHAVTEWDQLQADAEEIDGTLQVLTDEQPQGYPIGFSLTYSYPLSSWIYHYKLNQLGLVVLMGFELSIYAPDEKPKMYWQLSQICAVHLAHLDRMSHFVGEASRSAGHETSSSTDHGTAEVTGCVSELFREYSKLKATEALAKALHLLFAFIFRNGLLHKPPHTYAPDKLRYELRMKPFLHLSVPEPVPFDRYQEAALLPLLSNKEILDCASRESSNAKRSWEEVLKASQTSPTFPGAEFLTKEWTKDVKDTIRACIATGIAISTLKQRLALASRGKHKDGLGKIEVRLPAFGEDGCWHRWWLVPKIT